MRRYIPWNREPAYYSNGYVDKYHLLVSSNNSLSMKIRDFGIKNSDSKKL